MDGAGGSTAAGGLQGEGRLQGEVQVLGAARVSWSAVGKHRADWKGDTAAVGGLQGEIDAGVALEEVRAAVVVADEDIRVAVGVNVYKGWPGHTEVGMG